MIMRNIPKLAMLEKTRSVNTGMMRLFIPARNPEIPQFKQAISVKLTVFINMLAIPEIVVSMSLAKPALYVQQIRKNNWLKKPVMSSIPVFKAELHVSAVKSTF